MRQAEPAPAPPLAGPEGPRAVDVVRDGVVESTHRAVVAVADASGRLIAALGEVDRAVYPRSAVKPAQAAACLDVLAGDDPAGGVGIELDAAAVAIGTASHAGGDDHQIEAAHLLALAGLEESALRCPAAAPLEAPGEPRTPLAHNCSGKHALMLLATVVFGGDPVGYLEPPTPVQQAVRRRLTALAGEEPGGPGVDGCGAPAWRLSLVGLATLAARLTTATPATDPELAQVAAAMSARPELVGGETAPDTALMRAGPGVVAKRGAEGVLTAGTPPAWTGGPEQRGLGVAVKVVDGAARAATPLVAAVLAAAGVAVPEHLRHPPVLGGGLRRGSLRLTGAMEPALEAIAAR